MSDRAVQNDSVSGGATAETEARRRLQDESSALRTVSHPSTQGNTEKEKEKDRNLPGVNHDFAIVDGDQNHPDEATQSRNLEASKKRVQENNPADNARDALLSAADKNRLIAIGESHEQPSPVRRLLTENMEDLAKHGVTHMAVEETDQARLDHFNRTGDQNDLKPYINQDMKDLYNAAHKAGIQLVAVDKDIRTGMIEAQKKGESAVKEYLDATMRERNEAMAKGISAVLQDEKNKVVFLVGSAHLHSGAAGSPAVQDLVKANGTSAETMVAPQSRVQNNKENPFNQLASSAAGPRAISPRDSRNLADLRFKTDRGWVDVSGADRILVLP